MKSKNGTVILLLCLSFALVSCLRNKKTSGGSDPELKDNPDYLTLNEAVAALEIPAAAAKPAEDLPPSPELSAAYRPPFTVIEPIRLFDNLYFVGTTSVGAFVIDTGDGLIMLDTGNGDDDAAIMAEGLKKLGLDPSAIKLILLSHEHFDHYGGVRYLVKNICPGAKVAMSLVGWNMLQTVPVEWAYTGVRPQKVDVYLVDGMKIRIGNETVQIVSTPGHSPGCVSFIFPVTDNGVHHSVGIMGGSAVWPAHTDAHLYKSSVEYFRAYAEDAGCDIGLLFHSREADFTALRNRKPGESNPLVLGTEKFNTIYLQSFRDRYQRIVESGNVSKPNL